MKSALHYLLFSVIIATALFVAISCTLSTPSGSGADTLRVEIERYDRLEYRYLTTGDYSALQQMNTEYPTETRTLLENVLELGTVDDHAINSRFLNFYQDTTLQTVLNDVTSQYSDMSDISSDMTKAFLRLRKQLPDFHMPTVYAQIGAFGQSIIVGNNNTIGICLDKYLGKDYPIYLRYYDEQYRSTMTRKNIVPDCITFYLISLYPIANFEQRSQAERDEHIARVQWVVNYAMNQQFFNTDGTRQIDEYMKNHPSTTLLQLLAEQPVNV